MRRILITLLFAAAAAGCDGETAGPAAPAGDPPPGLPYYPLDIGGRWTYTSTFTIGFYDPDSETLIRADTSDAEWSVSLTGFETIGGVEYVTETTVVTGGGKTDTSWVRLRQDEAGLYRADIPRRFRPGDAAIDGITAPPVERVRLRFPLGAGVEWDLFPSTNTARAAVEAFDTLSTPAGPLTAWRIRIDAPGRGPDDSHRVWHGPDGKLQEIQHSEVIAIDDFTRERVRIVTESRLYLQGYEPAPARLSNSLDRIE